MRAPHFGTSALVQFRWHTEDFSMTIPRNKACLILALSLILTILTLPRGSKIIRPGPDAGFYPISKVQTHPFQTQSGLTVYVPDKGDQCWDAQLLCAPYPDSNLRLRTNDIARGFTRSEERRVGKECRSRW